MRPVDLLAIDIDGTLLNSQSEISQQDLTALRKAHEAGVEVAVVTGRRHRFAYPIVERLGFRPWIISSNGAIIRSMDGETHHRDLLSVETARAICELMDEFRGNLVLTFDKDEKGALALERMDELTRSIQRWLEKNLNYIDFVVPIENCLTSEPVQAMFCGTIDRMRLALGRLSGLKDRVTVVRTEYPERDLSIVDVLSRTCSKGTALRRWTEHRGIDRAKVMAIGDNYNDIGMLEYAGQPFIMGNAAPELMNRGWNVTASNDQCGVANAIDLAMGWVAVGG